VNELITVGGGVIAVYVVLALIVSQIVEWISTIFNIRGKLLYGAILEMLSESEAGTPSTARALVAAMYAHPLIGNLGMKTRPSYIGPRTFSISLIASLRALPAQPGRAIAPPPPLDADADALLGDLRTRMDAVLPAQDPLRKSLGLIIEQTDNTYDAVLKALDAWYQAQMDRVSGTFKRYTAYVQIALAFIVVYAFHVDTIALIDALSKSAAAQSAIAVAQTAEENKDVASAVASLANAGLIQTSTLKVFTFWLPASPLECVGVVLTWFAILLGAPFWFDVLKQFVPVRMSGLKPDAQAVAAGDKQAVVPRMSLGGGP
jgi:hypothetical protein